MASSLIDIITPRMPPLVVTLSPGFRLLSICCHCFCLFWLGRINNRYKTAIMTTKGKNETRPGGSAAARSNVGFNVQSFSLQSFASCNDEIVCIRGRALRFLQEHRPCVQPSARDRNLCFRRVNTGWPWQKGPSSIAFQYGVVYVKARRLWLGENCCGIRS